MFFYPELLSGFRRMQWDLGDTRLVNLVLEQSYRWARGFFTGQFVSLWNPPYFYPVMNVASYTDLFLGEAPLYWLARALGAGMEHSLLFLLFASSALNFGVAYLWLRRPLGFGRAGAAFGAFLFAFGYPRAVQLGHPALLPQFPMLLALYGVWRLFAGGAGGDAEKVEIANAPAPARADLATAMIFAGLALQLLTGFYLGWFLTLALALAALGAAACPVRRRALLRVLKRQWLVAAAAAAAAALLIAPMGKHYLEAAHDVGLRPFLATFQPRLQAWFYLGRESWLYRWQDSLKSFRVLEDFGPEQKIGIGWLTISCVLLGWWRIVRETKRGSALRLLGGVSVALFLLTTEFWPGFRPWHLIYDFVPGAKAVRAVSRVGLLLLVPEAVGLAAFVDWARKRRPRLASLSLVLAVIGAGVVLEQMHRAESFGIAEAREGVAQIRAALDSSCRFFLYTPWRDGESTPAYRYQVDAMWAAYDSGVPTINGYSGNAPRDWPFEDCVLKSRDDEKRVGGALADWMRERTLDPSGLCWLEPEPAFDVPAIASPGD